MRVLARLSVSAGLLAFAVTGPVAVSSADPTASPIVGHVYVNDNTAGTNTIAGFARHTDGSITALPGSPFAAGGAGLGTSTGSQGALQLSSNGRYLLAVDAGSNQISVLRVEPDGSLAQIPGGLVSSNGIEPDSIAVHDHLVYVANKGAGGSNYTGFTFHHGILSPIAGSTVALSDAADPGDVLINATGTNLVGTEVGPSLIDSFAVGHDGLLTPAGGSPYPAQGFGPFGSAFRPTDPSQLFVSNAHNGGTDLGTVSAFEVAGNGTLSSIGSSPFGDLQNAPCWVAVSPDGRYLVAVNTASSSVSSFAIAPNGSLTLIGSLDLRNIAGLTPTDTSFSPDGRNVYVVDGGGDVVSSLSISAGGVLTELPSSPTLLPAGAHQVGIAVS
jgi:6-phosphogluconolactonase (cycloisomerase 2 family)